MSSIISIVRDLMTIEKFKTDDLFVIVKCVLVETNVFGRLLKGQYTQTLGRYYLYSISVNILYSLHISTVVLKGFICLLNY